MAGIVNRRIFMGRSSDGLFRFAPWAVCNTSLGDMIEARAVNVTVGAPTDGGIPDLDASEMFQRIDAVEGYDPHGITFDENTIGGQALPVAGY